MRESTDGDGSRCPYLQPKIGGRLEVYYPAAVYCRLPAGQVQVPPPDRRAYVCSAGRYQECPTYQRWKSSARTSAWESPSARDRR